MLLLRTTGGKSVTLGSIAGGVFTTKIAGWTAGITVERNETVAKIRDAASRKFATCWLGQPAAR